MHFKGQAGSSVFRSSVLQLNSSVNPIWLQQIPLATECGRSANNNIVSQKQLDSF